MRFKLWAGKHQERRTLLLAQPHLATLAGPNYGCTGVMPAR